MFSFRLSAVIAFASLTFAAVASAQPKIQVMPGPTYDFGGGTPNSAMITQTWTVANIGGANPSLIVQKPTIGGTNPQNFAPDFGVYTNLFPITLGAGSSFSFTITFAPTAVQNYSATLNIASNDQGTPTAVVTMTGKGGYPAISFDTKTLIFGNQRVGVPSQAGVFTISDPGAGNLVINSITLGGANPGDFSFMPAAPQTVTTGGSLKLNVIFKPQALGGRSATITVVSNGNMGAQQTDTLNVIGQGTQATVVCPMGTIDFMNQTEFVASAPQKVTISNSSQVNMMGDSFNITGASFMQMNSNFAVSPPVPMNGIKVAPGGSATISLVAVPQTVGPVTDTLIISTDNNMNCMVPVKVNSVTGAIKVAPNPYVDFGPSPLLVDSKAQDLMVQNVGNAPLTISDFEWLGMNPVVFSSPNAPNPLPSNGMNNVVLPPGKSLNFSVVYHPTMVMADTAWIELHTDDPMNKIVRIPLSGEGVMEGFALSVKTLTFSGVPVSTVSAPQSFTINNTGGSPLTIDMVSLGGSSPGNFMIDQSGPFTLDPKGGKNDHQQVNVTFSPLSTANVTATVDVAVMGLKTQSVMLSGSGTAPLLGIAPQSLDFSTVQVNLKSDVQMVGLRNGGSIPFTIASITSSDPAFVIDMSATKVDLAPNAQTTFGVVFAPTDTKDYGATISVTLKGQTMPAQSITAKGSGVACVRNCGGGGGGHGCGISGRTDGAAWPLGFLLLAGLVAAALYRRAPTRARRR